MCHHAHVPARTAAAATPSGKPRALISVFDKTGLIELGKARAALRHTRARVLLLRRAAVIRGCTPPRRLCAR
jgi:hypothetical protein